MQVFIRLQKLKDRNSRKNEIKGRLEKSKDETILEAIESRKIKIQLAGLYWKTCLKFIKL